MTPILIHTNKSNLPAQAGKKKTLKKGIVFDASKKRFERTIEQRSLDADVVQKKKGTVESLNPLISSTPERY